MALQARFSSGQRWPRVPWQWPPFPRGQRPAKLQGIQFRMIPRTFGTAPGVCAHIRLRSQIALKQETSQ